MDTTSLFPGLEPVQVIKFACGACGGLIRTIEWIFDNPGQKIDFVLAGRNIFYGGLGGVVLGLEPVTAFTSGMAGEYLLQTIGKRKATTKTDAVAVAAEVDKPKTN